MLLAHMMVLNWNTTYNRLCYDRASAFLSQSLSLPQQGLRQKNPNNTPNKVIYVQHWFEGFKKGSLSGKLLTIDPGERHRSNRVTVTTWLLRNLIGGMHDHCHPSVNSYNLSQHRMLFMSSPVACSLLYEARSCSEVNEFVVLWQR